MVEQQHVTNQTARRLIIRGRVQGVGYRQWTRGEAIRLGLTGYVRNRIDGSVEAVIVGEPDVVAAMVAVCQRGPRGAQVESVEETPVEATATGPFEIRETA